MCQKFGTQCIYAFYYILKIKKPYFLLTHVFLVTSLIYIKNREQKMYECCVHVLCIT
jgi:hypothetical protein